MFIKKVLNKFFVLIKSKIFFLKPEEKDILVYDKEGDDFELLKKNLKNFKFNSLDVRQKELNIYILFKTIFNFSNNRSFFENYIINYIESANPKIIITIIDTNPFFYLIKKFFPHIKTIVIQNASRSKTIKENIQYLNVKDSKVDYALTFGDSIGLEYKKLFKCKNVTIGSFKNNNFKVKKKTKNNFIIHISNFPTGVPFYENKLQSYHQDKRVKNERFFLNILANFCKKKKLELFILPKKTNSNKGHIEREYYDYLLKSHNFQYLSKEHAHENYRKIDGARFVTSINSSFGLEALSRGAKVGFFFIFKSKFKNVYVSDILWPSKIKKRGPFWTNINSKNEILRVLNYLFLSNKKLWKKNYNIFDQTLIMFDYKNSKLKKLLLNLLKNNNN